MKYKDKYPNAQHMEMVENDILVGDKEVGCIQCGYPTKFIEVCSETYFCSEECCQTWYKGYFEYLRDNPIEDNNDFE